MSWQGQMSTIVRHLVNDLDSSSYKYSNQRTETSILVASQLMIMNVDFKNTYDILLLSNIVETHSLQKGGILCGHSKEEEAIFKAYRKARLSI